MPTFSTDTHDIVEFPLELSQIRIQVTEWMSIIKLPRTEGVIWPER